MNKKGFIGILIVFFFIILVLIFIAGIVYGVVYATTINYETITIKEKWIKYHGEDAKYLISSTNEQVFQITDTLIKWRWDSSNLYADLSEGDTCKIKTQGWRFPLISDYKNILEADC